MKENNVQIPGILLILSNSSTYKMLLKDYLKIVIYERILSLMHCASFYCAKLRVPS